MWRMLKTILTLTRLGLQCRTPFRFYPLSLIPTLVPYPIVLFLSRNLGDSCDSCDCCDCQLLVLGLRLEFDKNISMQAKVTHCAREDGLGYNV